MQQRKTFRMQSRAARRCTGPRGKLVGLKLVEAPQAALVILLASLKRPPQIWLELLELPHPVASTWSRRLVIYINPLPQDWSDSTKKVDANVDKNLSDNRNLMSIFRKIISDKLYESSIWGIYTRYRINLTADPVKKKTQQLVDLELSTINALDEGSDLSTPDTRIQSPTYGDYLSAPNQKFGETTAFRVRNEKSYYNYNYKTEFQI